MERPAFTQKILAVLILLIVITMHTQWSFRVPLRRAGGADIPASERAAIRSAAGGEQTENAARESPASQPRKGPAARVSVADILLAAAFALWLFRRLFQFNRDGIVWPPLAAVFLVAVALFSMIQAASRSAAMREAVQYVEYLLVGYLIFVNGIPSVDELKNYVNVFVLVTTVVVVYALYQYLGAGNAMDVKGTFGNRNVLGSYLAIALPFLLALGLYEQQPWRRLTMLLAVAVGCLATTTGGGLVAILVAVIAVSAARGQRALVPILVAIALAVALLPTGLKLLRGWVPRHHVQIVAESVELGPAASHLVDPQQTLHEVEAMVNRGRYVEADMLLRTIPPPFSNEADVLEQTIRVRSQLTEEAEQASRLPELAARYKGWHAATQAIRSADRKRTWLHGVGAGNYQDVTNEHYGAGALAKPHGRVDWPQFFNLYADEPDSFNQYLVLAVELGLLGLFGLAWWIGLFFGSSLTLMRTARDDFAAAVGLGACGSMIGFVLNGVFASGMVRGVALPFVFILAAVTVAARRCPGRAGQP